jgi:hypothetical protein
MAQTPSRFHTRITGTARAAQVVPVHSQHTASMIAQAARVPRLAQLTVGTRTAPASATRGGGARGGGGKR